MEEISQNNERHASRCQRECGDADVNERASGSKRRKVSFCKA